MSALSMKIGFDISQTGRDKAGCGCYAQTMARALIKYAPEHAYVLFPSFGAFTFDPGLQDQRHFSGNHVRYGPTHRVHREAAQFWSAPDVEEHLGAVDIIHSNNYWCPVQPLRARLIYTLHDLSFWECPQWHTDENRLACSAGVSNAAACADRIIAVSQVTKKHFLQCFPTFPEDRVEVVHPAVRFDASSLGAPPKNLALEPRRFWLMVGTLEPRKNHKRLIEAYARYLGSGAPRMPLVLAGPSGWLMDDLADHTATLGLSDLVVRAGYVPDDELIWLYRNCCAQVYVSLFEGSGLPLLEGMLFGAATIASNRNAVPEITAEAALLVSPTDTDAIAAALLRVARDESLRGDLSSRGRKRAAAFGAEPAVRRFIDVYAEAIAAPKRAIDSFYFSPAARAEIPYIANGPGTSASSGYAGSAQPEPAILSVVVPTRSSWPQAQDTIGPLIRYAHSAGIEVIVTNGEGEPTWPADLRARVRWLWRPGADIFVLRAEGLAAATSEIVAVTEDHCTPAPDWCARIVAAYRAHPDCTAIGGAIANGSDNTVVGRANFIITFARYLATGLTAPVPAISNMAVRRSALPEKIAAGWLEMEFLPALSRQPGAIRFSPDIVVTHIQDHGLWPTLVVHYHNGRACGGLMLTNPARDRLWPAIRFANTLRREVLRVTSRALDQAGLSRWRRMLRMIPVRLLALLHAIGIVVGLTRGPGVSPKRLD